MRKTIREIVETYRLNNRNISKTARDLKISRSTVKRCNPGKKYP